MPPISCHSWGKLKSWRSTTMNLLHLQQKRGKSGSGSSTSVWSKFPEGSCWPPTNPSDGQEGETGIVTTEFSAAPLGVSKGGGGKGSYRPMPYSGQSGSKSYRLRKRTPPKKKWQLIHCLSNAVLMPQQIHIVNHMLVKAVGMDFILPLKAGVPLKVAGRLAYFVNTGQLGNTGCQRLPDILCRVTYTEEEAKNAFLPLRAVSSDTRRSFLPSGERSSDGSRQSFPPNRVLLCPLPGPLKEWVNEAGYQPRSPQSMDRDTSLQDGRPDLCLRPVETGRLVGEGGSKGCFHDGTNTSRLPTLPPLHRRGSELSVHLSPLWTSMCSVGLHQGNEGSGDLTQVMGDQG